MAFSDILERDSRCDCLVPRGLSIGVPSVRPVWSHPIVHPGSSFAISIRGEVIGIAPGYYVVAFEIGI